ncbi:MAG TPA: hypothetical protein VLF41_01495, partial [Candidatus Nanoarchaeia archaeon]|nr:hypothetical protein [Candidatus Nanoarchaeia archaeon]
RAYKTDWQLSRELGVIAAEIGRTPTSRDIELGCQAGRCAHRDTYIRRFGSISEANRAAGLL